MIQINLLPEELKKSRRPSARIDISSIDFGKIPVFKIAAIAVGLVVVIQLAIFGFGLFYGAEFRSMEEDYKKIFSEKQTTEKLKSEISSMSKKISVIDELMVKRFSWAKKLNDMSDSMTAGIWLTQLDYDEKTVERAKPVVMTPRGESKPSTEKVLERYLLISGAASSMGEEGTALIGRFIEKLKDNTSFYADFSDIELGNIKREQSGNQEIMTFKITCLFKTK